MPVYSHDLLLVDRLLYLVALGGTDLANIYDHAEFRTHACTGAQPKGVHSGGGEKTL